MLERKYDMRKVNFLMSSLSIGEEVWDDGALRQRIQIASDKGDQFDFWINPEREYWLEAYRRENGKGQMMERYEAELIQSKDGTWYPRRIARVSGEYHDALEIIFIDDAYFNQIISEQQFTLPLPKGGDLIVDGMLIEKEGD